MIVVFTCSIGLSWESNALYGSLGPHSDSPGFYYILTPWLRLCCTCEHTLNHD